MTEDIPAQFFYSSVQNGRAVALWRLPNQTNYNGISSNNFEHAKGQNKEGFCFMPFEKNESGFFIPADYIIEFSKEQFEKEIPTKYFGNLNRSTSFTEVEFVTAISKVKAQMNSGELSKVVLSRNRFITLPTKFEVISFYKKLCDAYPHAFVFLVALPETGIWVGASPEILLQANGQNMETVALAGTLRPGGESVWTEKEEQEQEIISQYISQKLHEENIFNFKMGKTETISIGQLKHLSTGFSFNTNRYWWPIACSLHPTPAVCGYPQSKSYEQIHKLEPHHRGFYSGFCGPCNNQGSTHLYVNIRFMRLHLKEAELFAGAGITRQSDPYAEWKETEAKLQAIQQFI